MAVKLLIAFLGILGISIGLPVEQNGNQQYVPGVFLSAEAFKNLQDKANLNDQSQLNQNNDPKVSDPSPMLRMNQEQSFSNQPLQPSYPVQNQQAAPLNQQPVTQQVLQQGVPQQVLQQAVPQQQLQLQLQQNQQPITQHVLQQTVPTLQSQQSVPQQVLQQTVPQQLVYQNPPQNQPQYIQQNQQPLLSQPLNQQQYLVAQPNQQPIYIGQQQQTSAPIMLTQQPGQGLIYPTQSQPTYVSSVPQNGIIATPINSQPLIGKPMNVGQVQNQGSLYAMVPVSGQNTATNVGGTYLVPVQQMSSTPILLNAGK